MSERPRRTTRLNDTARRVDTPRVPSRTKGTVRRKVTFPIREADLPPTAKKLLDAAQRVLETSGYRALSYESIGREAGLSPGLIRYHFGSKSELLVALSDWIVFRNGDVRAGSNEREIPEGESGVQTLIRYVESMLANMESYALYFNLLLHILDDEQGRAQLAGLFARNLDMATEAFAVDTDAEESEELRLLASMTAALSDGLAVQLIVDPSFASVEKALSRWRDYLEWSLQRRCSS